MPDPVFAKLLSDLEQRERWEDILMVLDMLPSKYTSGYYNEKSPPHILARLGYSNYLKEAIQNGGVGPNARDTSGKTLLMVAAEYGRMHTLDMLLDDVGADLDLIGGGANRTALTFAVANCNSTSSYKTAEYLLARGADPNVRNTTGGWSSLMTACVLSGTTSSPDAIKLLLYNEANVNYQDNGGWTALRIIAENHGKIHQDVFHDLMKFGADPTIADKLGITPLMAAARRGNISFIDKLLKRTHVGINLVDNKGRTALMRLMHPDSYNPNIVNILLEHGADITIEDHEGKTALMMCAENLTEYHDKFEDGKKTMQTILEHMKDD